MTEPHDHEFIHEDAEWTADEVLLCTIQCEYVPVYGSQYSERWDEFFYDEGPRCEATKHIKWDFDGVYYDLRVSEGDSLDSRRAARDDNQDANTPVKQADGKQKIEYEDNEIIWEEVVITAEEVVNNEDRLFDPESEEPAVRVGYEGDEYVVKWTDRTESVNL